MPQSRRKMLDTIDDDARGIHRANHDKGLVANARQGQASGPRVPTSSTVRVSTADIAPSEACLGPSARIRPPSPMPEQALSKHHQVVAPVQAMGMKGVAPPDIHHQDKPVASIVGPSSREAYVDALKDVTNSPRYSWSPPADIPIQHVALEKSAPQEASQPQREAFKDSFTACSDYGSHKPRPAAAADGTAIAARQGANHRSAGVAKVPTQEPGAANTSNFHQQLAEACAHTSNAATDGRQHQIQVPQHGVFQQTQPPAICQLPLTSTEAGAVRSDAQLPQQNDDGAQLGLVAGTAVPTAPVPHNMNPPSLHCCHPSEQMLFNHLRLVLDNLVHQRSMAAIRWHETRVSADGHVSKLPDAAIQLLDEQQCQQQRQAAGGLLMVSHPPSPPRSNGGQAGINAVQPQQVKQQQQQPPNQPPPLQSGEGLSGASRPTQHSTVRAMPKETIAAHDGHIKPRMVASDVSGGGRLGQAQGAQAPASKSAVPDVRNSRQGGSSAAHRMQAEPVMRPAVGGPEAHKRTTTTHRSATIPTQGQASAQLQQPANQTGHASTMPSTVTDGIQLTDWQDIIKELLELCMLNPESKGAFNQPVDPVAFNIPHYWKVIKRPMDLGTILNLLEQGAYTHFTQVLEHMFLVYCNCMTFNSSPNLYHLLAKEMENQFVAVLTVKLASLEAAAIADVAALQDPPQAFAHLHALQPHPPAEAPADYEGVWPPVHVRKYPGSRPQTCIRPYSQEGAAATMRLVKDRIDAGKRDSAIKRQQVMYVTEAAADGQAGTATAQDNQPQQELQQQQQEPGASLSSHSDHGGPGTSAAGLHTNSGAVPAQIAAAHTQLATHDGHIPPHVADGSAMGAGIPSQVLGEQAADMRRPIRLRNRPQRLVEVSPQARAQPVKRPAKAAAKSRQAGKQATSRRMPLSAPAEDQPIAAQQEAAVQSEDHDSPPSWGSSTDHDDQICRPDRFMTASPARIAAPAQGQATAAQQQAGSQSEDSDSPPRSPTEKEKEVTRACNELLEELRRNKPPNGYLSMPWLEWYFPALNKQGSEPNESGRGGATAITGSSHSKPLHSTVPEVPGAGNMPDGTSANGTYVGGAAGGCAGPSTGRGSAAPASDGSLSNAATHAIPEGEQNGEGAVVQWQTTDDGSTLADLEDLVWSSYIRSLPPGMPYEPRPKTDENLPQPATQLQLEDRIADLTVRWTEACRLASLFYGVKPIKDNLHQVWLGSYIVQNGVECLIDLHPYLDVDAAAADVDAVVLLQARKGAKPYLNRPESRAMLGTASNTPLLQDAATVATTIAQQHQQQAGEVTLPVQQPGASEVATETVEIHGAADSTPNMPAAAPSNSTADGQAGQATTATQSDAANAPQHAAGSHGVATNRPPPVLPPRHGTRAGARASTQRVKYHKTKYAGVYRIEGGRFGGLYVSTISFEVGRASSDDPPLGYFKSACEAAMVRDCAGIALHDHPQQHFPNHVSYKRGKILSAVQPWLEKHYPNHRIHEKVNARITTYVSKAQPRPDGGSSSSLAPASPESDMEAAAGLMSLQSAGPVKIDWDQFSKLHRKLCPNPQYSYHRPGFVASSFLEPLDKIMNSGHSLFSPQETERYLRRQLYKTCPLLSATTHRLEPLRRQAADKPQPWCHNLSCMEAAPAAQEMATATRSSKGSSYELSVSPALFL